MYISDDVSTSSGVWAPKMPRRGTIKEDQMRRKFPVGMSVVAIAGAITLAACGGGGNGDGGSTTSGGGSEGGTTELSIWHGYTEADGKVLDDIVNQFNDSQEACVVNPEPIAWSSITEKLLTGLGAGNGPNIVVQGVDSGLGYGNQGAFQDVQAFYDDDQYTSTDALFPQLVEQVTWDGKAFGVPMGTAAFSVWYNTELWEAAGLTEADYPTTMDELFEVAKKLTAGDVYGMAVPDADAGFLSTILHSGGGDFITDGVPAVDSPENIETLETWQKLFVEDKISPTGMNATAAMELFGAGRAAMILNGPWEITSAESFGIEIGVFQWPSDWVAGVANYWYSTSMNDTDAETLCSYQFFDWWNSKEMQVVWQDSYYPPNRNDIPESELTDPLVATISGFSDKAHYYATGIDTGILDITNETDAMMQQITKGGDVKALAEAAQAKLEGYLGD